MLDRKRWSLCLIVTFCIVGLLAPTLLLAQEDEEEEEPAQTRPNPMEFLTRTWGETITVPGFGSFSMKAKESLAEGRAVIMRVRNVRALRRFGVEARAGERMRISAVNGRLRIEPLQKGAKGIVLKNVAKRGIILHRSFTVGGLAKPALRVTPRAGQVQQKGIIVHN